MIKLDEIYIKSKNFNLIDIFNAYLQMWSLEIPFAQCLSS